MSFDSTQFDLHTVEIPDGDLSLEQIPEGVALATYSTYSTMGTASCPSSAGSIMTANCYS